jgi:hypothetical protein
MPLGYYDINGLNAVSSVKNVVKKTAKTIWTLPNSAAWLAVGIAGLPFGGAPPYIRDGNIIFEKNPLLVPGSALNPGGHVHNYGWPVCKNGTEYGTPDDHFSHESRHGDQGDVVGPFFLPSYLYGSLIAAYNGNPPYFYNPYEYAAYHNEVWPDSSMWLPHGLNIGALLPTLALLLYLL